jgi:hypothetical protein
MFKQYLFQNDFFYPTGGSTPASSIDADASCDRSEARRGRTCKQKKEIKVKIEAGV